jgi:hypothetical protein
VLSPNTAEAFERLATASAMDVETGRHLAEAARLLARVQGLIRLTVGEGLDESVLPAGLKARLARAGGVPDLDTLKARLADAMGFVRACYDDLIDTPAAHLKLPSDRETKS